MSTEQASGQEKMERIIEGLAGRAQSLGWEATADEDMFIVSFPTHSVTLRKWTVPGGGWSYNVAVIDSGGRELESVVVSDWDGDLHTTTQGLYNEARRVALQVNEGLDAVLKEIEAV